MPVTPGPSISAVVAAYQAEEWIAETLESILGQSRPPDEVVVVDDGSTDGTGRILHGYANRIRVLHQENAGYPAAMNRAIKEARSDFVALCGADDLWEPRKLEWQAEALTAHPEVGFLFGHAVLFGLVERDHERPTGRGLLDGQVLWEDLFRINSINMPSAVIRRGLFDRIGWFTDKFLADDYEFFFRCLRAGVRFYYEPRTVVRYRRHDDNITNSTAEWHHAMYLVRSRNADRIPDRRLVTATKARDLFKIGRAHVDEGCPVEARRAFRRSLRYACGNTMGANLRALVWIAILGLPRGVGEQVGRALAGLRSTVNSLRQGEQRAPA